MRLLLDTHALIWWFQGSGKLSLPARDAIDNASEPVLVSVVSVFEMTTKFRLGKLPGIDDLLANVPAYLDTQAFQVLPIGLNHAETAGALKIPHRDPFDRLLIAQAQIEQVWLVSNEALFDQFGVRRIW